MLYMSLQNRGLDIWNSIFSWADLFYIITNGITSISRLQSEQNAILSLQQNRQVQSFLSLVIFIKAIYFLQLID